MWKGWTDISSGIMTLPEIFRDVAFQVIHRLPKRIVIDIKYEDKRYRTKIWISAKDFKVWRD